MVCALPALLELTLNWTEFTSLPEDVRRLIQFVEVAVFWYIFQFFMGTGLF